MRLTVQLDMDTRAFYEAHPGEGGIGVWAHEARRVLRSAADDIAGGARSGVLQDKHGSQVGRWDVT